MHAYWAANAWALYAGADKFLTLLWKKAGWFNIRNQQVASMTGGLVQEDAFTILPTPTPLITFFITFGLMIVRIFFLYC